MVCKYVLLPHILGKIRKLESGVSFRDGLAADGGCEALTCFCVLTEAEA